MNTLCNLELLPAEKSAHMRTVVEEHTPSVGTEAVARVRAEMNKLTDAQLIEQIKRNTADIFPQIYGSDSATASSASRRR